MNHQLRLHCLPSRLVIVQLPPRAELPDWVWASSMTSVTRTHAECSVVCDESAIPVGVDFKRDMGWRALMVEGPLDFGLTGVLASLAVPLAQAGISIFAVSTFDTDCVLVKATDLERACAVLTDAGHTVSQAGIR